MRVVGRLSMVKRDPSGNAKTGIQEPDSCKRPLSSVLVMTWTLQGKCILV